MQTVAVTTPGRVEIVTRPDPTPRDEFVVVKVEAAPTCTEYKILQGGHTAAALGHEAAGVVAEVARPGRVRVGDRVVVMPQTGCGQCALCVSGDYIHCQHAPSVPSPTYAQYVLKQDWLLLPVPADLPIAHAGMACCGLGPSFGALRRMGVRAPDTLLVTGLGPVGLGAVINGVAVGARVIGVEQHPYRARLALALGAEVVLDPREPRILDQIRGLTGGVGVDRGLDCSGAAQAQRLLIDGVRRRGHVAFVGEGGDLTVDVSRDLLRKGLTLHGNWHFNLADGSALMALIPRLRDQIDRFITHTLPMSRVDEAWALQAAGECGKVVLDPWS